MVVKKLVTFYVLIFQVLQFQMDLMECSDALNIRFQKSQLVK